MKTDFFAIVVNPVLLQKQIQPILTLNVTILLDLGISGDCIRAGITLETFFKIPLNFPKIISFKIPGENL